MRKIAFAALAVLGIAVGAVNFAAPAHAYYYGMSREGANGPRTTAVAEVTTDATRIVIHGEARCRRRPLSFPTNVSHQLEPRYVECRMPRIAASSAMHPYVTAAVMTELSA